MTTDEQRLADAENAILDAAGYPKKRWWRRSRVPSIYSHKIDLRGPTPAWSKKDFDLLMLLGTGTLLTIVFFPWGMFSYAALAIIAGCQKEK